MTQGGQRIAIRRQDWHVALAEIQSRPLTYCPSFPDVAQRWNVCDPIEVAAGCDINAYRQQFGNRMAYRQGVDKRCIAKGGSVIEEEIERIAPVLKSGGFVPGCDHGVPFDISWQDFIHYSRLLAEMTGWL